MSFTPVTQSGSGEVVQVDNDSICALIQSLTSAGVTVTEIVTREQVANLFTDLTVAATLASLTPPALSTALFVNANSGLPVRIVGGGVDKILPEGLLNSQVILLDGTVVYVVGTPAAVAAAIAAATPIVKNRVVAQAFIDNAGQIVSQVSDFGIVLSLAAPYVPGSGSSLLLMTGPNVPATYQILCDQQGNPSGSAPAEPTARQIAPNSPTFVVGWNQASRQVAGSQTAGGGGMLNSYGLVNPPAHPGPGVYDYTLLANPGAFLPLAGSADPVNGAIVSARPTGPTTLQVLTTVAGVPTDTDHFLQVSGLGQPAPTEPFFGITIIASNP